MNALLDQAINKDKIKIHMHSNLNVLHTYYPSLPTAYYATGQWLEEKNVYPPRAQAKYVIVDKGTTDEQLKFRGSSLKTFNTHIEFFRGHLSIEINHDKPPSSIRDWFWLQAKVPKSLYPRFLKITNNSGRFIINVKASQVDGLWNLFLKAYQEGQLGYGLQCQTSYSDDVNPGILVFTEDAFELIQIAAIAWKIDKILEDWKGEIYYCTDREIKHKYKGTKVLKEERSLYTISSFSFKVSIIGKPCIKKTLSEFVEYFVRTFRGHAQKRQEMLFGKNWYKFL